MERTVRTPERTCGNCRYFDQVAATHAVCRIRAPTITAVVLGIGQTEDGCPVPQWAKATLYPEVGSQDWCGEHMKKLDS